MLAFRRDAASFLTPVPQSRIFIVCPAFPNAWRRPFFFFFGRLKIGSKYNFGKKGHKMFCPDLSRFFSVRIFKNPAFFKKLGGTPKFR